MASSRAPGLRPRMRALASSARGGVVWTEERRERSDQSDEGRWHLRGLRARGRECGRQLAQKRLAACSGLLGDGPRRWEDGSALPERPEGDEMKRAAQRPVLITDADRSPADQLRSRQIRYVLMMSVRAVCLVVATILAVARVPLLWLWVPLCLVGMVVIPWLAVILANDRPPKDQHRFVHRLHRHEPPPHQALPPARSDDDARTIDIDQ